MRHRSQDEYADSNQFSQRWASGRSKDWDIIDSPTSIAEQQLLLAQVDREIVAASALNSGNNYLTSTVNQPIALDAPAQVYVSKGRPAATKSSSAATRQQRNTRTKALQAAGEGEEEVMVNDSQDDSLGDRGAEPALPEATPARADQVQVAAMPPPPLPVAPAVPVPQVVAPPLEMIH